MNYIYIIIALALFFDFLNGFHDAANSIATVVSTKVLSPLAAVGWAAFFNFVAFLVFGLHVANTIGKGVVNTEFVTLSVVAGGLLGAIVWDIITWWWGLPTSSSHALVGGFVGAAVAKAGFGSIVKSGLYNILIFIVVSPVLGLILAYIISHIVVFICKNSTPSNVDKHFRRLQLLSAAAYSLGHGGNDAQKSMGIIAVALFVTRSNLSEKFHVPFWVVIACHIAMGLGTLFGGWRIVKTMGQRITKLKPFEGFCAEAGGALTLFSTVALGVPVSTTHTITGAIVGVGARNRLSAVRWGVTLKVIWAWVLTIPCSAGVAAACYLIINALK